MQVTIDQVMSWQPCGSEDPNNGPYNREYVRKLFGRRKYLTAIQILDLDIPDEDKLWAVLREELIPSES